MQVAPQAGTRLHAGARRWAGTVAIPDRAGSFRDLTQPGRHEASGRAEEPEAAFAEILRHHRFRPGGLDVAFEPETSRSHGRRCERYRIDASWQAHRPSRAADELRPVYR